MPQLALLQVIHVIILRHFSNDYQLETRQICMQFIYTITSRHIFDVHSGKKRKERAIRNFAPAAIHYPARNSVLYATLANAKKKEATSSCKSRSLAKIPLSSEQRSNESNTNEQSNEMAVQDSSFPVLTKINSNYVK